MSTTIQNDFPHHLTMLCAVLISVTFCSSVADRWPGSNWRFWSDPFLIVPNAPVVTGTVFVLAFHILLIAMSSSLYLLSSSVSFVLMFGSSAMAVSISRQVFFFSFFNHAILYQVCLVVLFQCAIAGTSHMMVVPVAHSPFRYTSLSEK